VVLTESVDMHFGSILRYRSSYIEKFCWLLFTPSVIAFSGPSPWSRVSVGEEGVRGGGAEEKGSACV
jgi:hypothetical protein